MLIEEPPSQLDRLVGLTMLVGASVVFLYYTIWTLLMVCKILIYTCSMVPFLQEKAFGSQAIHRLTPNTTALR